jgi:putative sterol carrier protein
MVLNEVAPRPSSPRAWRLEFDDHSDAFTLAFDGKRWSLADADPAPDVVVRTTSRAWAAFVTRPPARRRLPTREIRVSGAAHRIAELAETLGAVSVDRPRS